LRKSIDNLFGAEPDAEEKAWDIIHEFYHLVLTKMERDGLSRADLARKLNKSRASVSQMFNNSPNLSIMKMMEIAHAIDLEISLKEGSFQSTTKYITANCNSFSSISEDYSQISSLTIGCKKEINISFIERNEEFINVQ